MSFCRISEYAWISLPPDFKGDPSKNIWGKSVDERTQGRWLVEGYQRAMSEWPWMGVMFVWNLNYQSIVGQGDEKWGFGYLRPDYTGRPAFAALAAMPK